MAKPNAFTAHVCEMMAALGHVSVRPFFGGLGLRIGEVFFGFISDDVVYLKVDDTNRADYAARDLGPFMYPSPKGLMATSYHRVPEETLDDPDEMTPWAKKALAAAQRAKAKKPAKKKRAAKKSPSAPRSAKKR